eukprot:gene8440-10367_t
MFSSKLILLVFVICTIFIQNGYCLSGAEGLLYFKPSSSLDFKSSRPDDSMGGWTADPSDLNPEIVVASDSMKRIIEIRVSKKWDKNTNSYITGEYITKVQLSYSLTGFGYTDYGIIDLDLSPTKDIVFINFPSGVTIFARSIKLKVLNFVGKASAQLEVVFEYAPQNVIGTVRSLSPVLYTPLPGGATRIDKIPVVFYPPLPYVPNVILSISAISASQTTDHMIYVKPDNITENGFDANFVLWGNTIAYDIVASYSAVWIQPEY